MGGANDATVSSNATEGDRRSAEVSKKRIERCLIKSRVHGLQDEVVLVIRRDLLHKLSSDRFLPNAVLQYLFGIRTPLPKIVVYINDRNFGPPGPAFELHQAVRHRHGLVQELATIGEFEIVQQIDEEYNLR